MAIRIFGTLYCLVFVLVVLSSNSARVAADCRETTIGVENMYVIPNSSFTASSFFSSEYRPSNARLNGYHGWGPGKKQYTNAYLQIDLGYPYVICAIATQGSNVKTEWVETYKIKTSINGTEWAYYEENEQVKVFTGNTDSNTVVKNTVKKKPMTRYIRIYPISYHYWLTMRVGLFGYSEACDNLPLGMQSNAIQGITASSAQHLAKNARLYYTSGSSWCAFPNDTNPYLQIDLGSLYLLCAVATQGNNSNQWVKTYQIDTSTDGTTWTTYQENNTDRVFQGNFDGSIVVRHVLFHGTVTRYIRFLPKTNQTTPCLRTEIYGYQVNQTCSNHSLGIPSPNLVPNSRFTATSIYNKQSEPYMGRLGSTKTWSPAKKDSYDYLQIDIGAVSYICSIATQGNGNSHEWVKEYKVLYSISNNQWITYGENGTDKNFLGNTDKTTVVSNSIKNLFKAKFIRILPTKFYVWKSMRVDFKGLSAACVSSLGLENSYLPDSQITTSSYSNNFHTASHARLYSSSSWCSSSSANTEYIMVDLVEVKTVTGIATQGDEKLNKWVTSYKVNYSFDSTNWKDYKEGPLAKVFTGNNNNIDVIVNWLSHPIAARYVRILPQSNSGGPCLRFDLYGCTYYIPESLSTRVTPKKRSARMTWTNIQTLEGTAEFFTITVSNTTGLSQTLNISNQTNSTELANLRPFTKYEVRIIAVKTKGHPLWQSASLTFKTLIAEPEGIPTIESTATSSRSINVTIKFTQTDKIHGPMAGYRIFYTPEGGTKNETNVDNVTTATLTNLEKYTVYNISVSVRNTMYVGPASAAKQQRTLEDVPDSGPEITQKEKVNATSYRVAWKPLTEQQSNGKVTKYEIIWYPEITFQLIGSCQEFSKATTRESEYMIRNLRPNEKYNAHVRGYTSVGPGPNTTISFLTSSSETVETKSSMCTTEGNAITFGCLTTSGYAGTVRYNWIKDGVEIDPAFVKMKGNELTLKSVGEENFGTYVCNATNSQGTVVFTTTIYELKKCSGETKANESASETVETKSSMCTTEGNAITFGCLTTNKYAGNVRYNWTKDGEKLKIDPAVVKMEEKELRLKAVGEDNFGTYVCNATNSQGTVVFTTAKYELKKCSGETDPDKKATKANEMIYYIVPPLVLVIIIILGICVYLGCRVRSRLRPDDEKRLRRRDAEDGPPDEVGGVAMLALEPREEQQPPTAPEQNQDAGERPADYMEIPAAMQSSPSAYESLDNTTRAAREEEVPMKGVYMELKPRGQASTYETLHRGDEIQDAELFGPGYVNTAIDRSEA